MQYIFITLWGVLLFNSACLPTAVTKDDKASNTISSKTASLSDLIDQLEHLLNSSETVSTSQRSEVNSLVWEFQQGLDILKKVQEKAWNNFTPRNCSAPLAPSNGGLVCVTIASVRYCKPMCNQGYDFAFLRKSRLFEECGIHTGYSWTTQLVGGNKLADCIASSVAVSGQTSAYFPTDMNCHKTIANSAEEEKHIRIFLQDLQEHAKKTITEKDENLYGYVICGY
ncbi:uncharacterized protein LOC115095563 [Rhinatrema bivittatum]|uniref:uncharacterized protein LOC115095563 n=1 Tax=Rhinatrema bivittatum TaxID=194408 RepID=UPI00112ACD8D|nr:uncharacterized protein LOC115095563 [Rhinatrema bivittatum]